MYSPYIFAIQKLERFVHFRSLLLFNYAVGYVFAAKNNANPDPEVTVAHPQPFFVRNRALKVSISFYFTMIRCTKLLLGLGKLC